MIRHIGKVYLLGLALLVIGCAKKPVQAPIANYKVVNPACVQNLRCEGEWRVDDKQQLFCTKLKANLACIPAK